MSRFSIEITSEGLEIITADPVESEKLKRIFGAMAKYGLEPAPTPNAPEDQPMESRIIQGRLCG